VAIPNVPIPTLGGKQLWADCFHFGGWRIQENVVTGHHRLLDPKRVRHAWGTYEECRSAFERLRVSRGVVRNGDHLVVLLHGIFRAAEAWRPMVRALVADGYEAAAVTYPSTRRGIELLADPIDALIASAEGIRTVSFVTHSMGGLIAREILGRSGGWRDRVTVNRLVMIATPNRGAVIADRLAQSKLFREVAGPAGVQLTTDYVPELPRPTCRFAVIAGSRGDGRGFNPLLAGEDDLTVTVDSVLLDGAEDSWVVPGALHTFIMQRPDVVAATVSYLRTGHLRAGPPGQQALAWGGSPQ
jgi:pimeloyl-ACP methyl ester carboxylesterase